MTILGLSFAEVFELVVKHKAKRELDLGAKILALLERVTSVTESLSFPDLEEKAFQSLRDLVNYGLSDNGIGN